MQHWHAWHTLTRSLSHSLSLPPRTHTGSHLVFVVFSGGLVVFSGGLVVFSGGLVVFSGGLFFLFSGLSK